MYVCLSVFSSVLMEYLGSHWTDFYEIPYFSVFRKYVEKIQVALNCDKSNWYFKLIPIYIYDHTWSVNTVRELPSVCLPWQHWTKALL